MKLKTLLKIQKKIRKLKWFTLVELIVVITIIAILWTIAFISFTWYSSNARDWVRISDINNMQKWLWIFQIKSWVYPLPDDYITVSASWNTILYQGYVGNNVSRIINLNTIPLDPLDSNRYLYSTNDTKSKYQLLVYMERWDTISINNSYFVNTTYAAIDYNKRYPKVKWDSLGIFLNTWTLDPVNSNIDIILTNNNTDYTTYFTNSDIITSSWNALFSNIYNRRDDLIKNKEIAEIDNSLIWYWDMKTTVLSWTTNELKDFSKYLNNWTLGTWLLLQNNWLYFPWENYLGPTQINGYLRFYSNILWKPGVTNIDWLSISVSLEHYMDTEYFNFLTWSNINQYKKSLIKSHINNVWEWGVMLYIERGKLWLLTRAKDWWILEDYLSNIEIKKDKKYNIICVMNYKNKEASFYIDWNKVDTHIFNQLEQTYYSTNINSTSDNIWYSTSYSRFKWIMSHLRLYNRVLWDSEVKALYYATK